jgi:hypothetical protein
MKLVVKWLDGKKMRFEEGFLRGIEEELGWLVLKVDFEESQVYIGLTLEEAKEIMKGLKEAEG